MVTKKTSQKEKSNTPSQNTQKTQSTDKNIFLLLSDLILKAIYDTLTFWLKDGFQLKEASILLAIIVPFIFLELTIFEWISSLWPPLGVWSYGAILALSISSLLNVARTAPEEYFKSKSEFRLIIVLASSLGVLIGFSQISRYLYIIFGGFYVNQAGYWHWFRFGIANILESILFDIPSIYDWNISEIYATAFWSKSIVFLTRTSIEFLVVAQSLNGIKIAKTLWKQSPRATYSNYLGFIFSKLGGLIIVSAWGIPLAITVGGIANEGISLTSTLTALKLTSPVILGFWLLWNNFYSLFNIGGKWGKLVSLISLYFGWQLVQSNWHQIINLIKF